MTDIQPKIVSADEGSDDEPLKNLVKPGRKRFSKETKPNPASGFVEDASSEETSKEKVSTAEKVPGHSSDDEPLSKLIKAKKSVSKSSDAESPRHSSDDEPLNKLVQPKKSVSKRSDAAGKEPSDSEDDEPLTMVNKQKKGKKQKPDKGEPVIPDGKKAKSPKKRKMEAKATQLRDSSPSPVKVTQKRGKTARSRDMLLEKSLPQMKKAVVLLKRLSEQDVKTIINQRHKEEKKSTVKAGSESVENSSDEEPLNVKLKRLKGQRKRGKGSKAAADVSSDDEPLTRRVKTVKTKDKRRKTADQEEDTVKQEKEPIEGDE